MLTSFRIGRGQPVRMRVEVGLEAEGLGDRRDPRLDLVGCHAQVAWAERQLVGDRPCEELVSRVLEHVPDVAGHASHRMRGRVQAVDDDPSRGRSQQPVEVLGERRLARPVLPHDGDHRSPIDRERHGRRAPPCRRDTRSAGHRSRRSAPTRSSPGLQPRERPPRTVTGSRRAVGSTARANCGDLR